MGEKKRLKKQYVEIRKYNWSDFFLYLIATLILLFLTISSGYAATLVENDFANSILVLHTIFFAALTLVWLAVWGSDEDKQIVEKLEVKSK